MSLHSSTTFLAKAPTSVLGERLFTRMLEGERERIKRGVTWVDERNTVMISRTSVNKSNPREEAEHRNG